MGTRTNERWFRLLVKGLACVVLLLADNKVRAQFISDVNGAPVRALQHTEVDGSPYLNENLSIGSILMRNGASVPDVLLNYHIYSDELEFKRDGALFRVSADIAGFTISSNGHLRQFRNGFPAVDRQQVQSFYQVIYQGNVVLLKRYRVTVRESKVYNSGTVTKVFVPDFDYYVFKGGRMFSVGKGGKKRWLEILADKKEQIEAMISEEKIALKTEAGMVLLLSGYDQL